MQEYCIKISSNIYFEYLLESPHWGDSNKYSKHMSYGEIRIKQGLSYIPFCPLRILYNSKFILMATFLGTNAVVVTRIRCMWMPQLKVWHILRRKSTPTNISLILPWTNISWVLISILVLIPSQNKEFTYLLTYLSISMKTYIVGIHSKCLREALLMNTHNICFMKK